MYSSQLPSGFSEWACSLSGCDGGNPDADVWLSGIEWGNPYTAYYKEELPKEIQAGPYTPGLKIYDWQEHMGYSYGRNVAKLYCAIKNIPVETYREATRSYHGTELFKMNLYPIAFSNTDDKLWQINNLHELTGFQDKHLFKTWCFLNRFPKISNFTKTKAPKLIIGTGVTYLTDFLACFAGSLNLDGAIQVGSLLSKSSKEKPIRKYYWAKLTNGTTIVVIPFFSGQFGLNSNDLIQQMGNKIRALCSLEI